MLVLFLPKTVDSVEWWASGALVFVLFNEESFERAGPRNGQQRSWRKPTKKGTENSRAYQFGTWNVRTLRELGKLDLLLKEMERIKLDVLGLCEKALERRRPFRQR